MRPILDTLPSGIEVREGLVGDSEAAGHDYSLPLGLA